MNLVRFGFSSAATAVLFSSLAAAQVVYRVEYRGPADLLIGNPAGVSLGDEVALVYEFSEADYVVTNPGSSSAVGQVDTFLSQKLTVNGVERPIHPIPSCYFTIDGYVSAQTARNGTSHTAGANYGVGDSQADYIPDVSDPLTYAALNFWGRQLEYYDDNGAIVIARPGTYSISVVPDEPGIGMPVCEGLANSTNGVASLRLDGSDVVADNDLTISVSGLPDNSMGYVVTSMETTTLFSPSGSEGNLCIASFTMGRFSGNVLDSGTTGVVSFSPDLTMFPSPDGIVSVMVGETRYFQHWYRDTDGMGSPSSNFSGAQGITFM